MSAVETWREARSRLGDMSEAQLEAIRRAGARRRHEQRVAAAQAEFDALVAEIMRSSDERDRRGVVARVRGAIERALDCIGAPGSACGSSPPGWYRAHGGADAWAAAMRHVLGGIPTRGPIASEYVWQADDGVWTNVGIWDGDMSRDAHFVSAAPGVVQIIRDDEDCTVVAEISVDRFPALAEHMLADAIGGRAAAVDEWLVACVGDMPTPPDAGACEEYRRIVERRRGGIEVAS